MACTTVAKRTYALPSSQLDGDGSAAIARPIGQTFTPSATQRLSLKMWARRLTAVFLGAPTPLNNGVLAANRTQNLKIVDAADLRAAESGVNISPKNSAARYPANAA